MGNPKYNKRVGTAFENKVAKELSKWMFGDPTYLKRNSGEGAQKHIWCGDIIPVKNIPFDWNFYVECKKGYPSHSPNFWRYTKLKEWFVKAYIESKMHDQYNILIVTKFKNRKKTLLTTNVMLDGIMYQVNFPIWVDELQEGIFAYVYFYDEILSYDFNEIFNKNFKRC